MNRNSKSNESKGMMIATDEHGLTECGCGANDLSWSAPDDYNANEADHTLEEAREIGGSFVWKNWDRDEFNEDLAGHSFDKHVEKHKEKARRNGVRASCSQCYGSMSPTVATQELRDHASTKQ